MDTKMMFADAAFLWAKYTSYTVETRERHGPFVLPDKGAKLQVYNAMGSSTQMMLDALITGGMIARCENVEEEIKYALSFVSQYGTLGMMNYLPKDADFYRENEVWLDSGNVLTNKKSLPRSEYLAYFLGENSDSEQAVLADALNKPEVYNALFSPYYSEPLTWCIAFFSLLYSHFEAWFHQRGDYEIDTDIAETRKIAGEIGGRGIAFAVDSVSRPNLEWEFGSLRTLIELEYSLACADKAAPLKLCKHCGKPFYNTNARSEFCSPRCRNQWNVYKSRRK